jgi:hypothetical protein
MTMRTTMLAAAMIATPFMAFAQSNNPTANMGTNKSSTAPSTSAPAAGMTSADTNATTTSPTGAAMSPRVPGATGQTVVPGSNSTVAGDRPATANSKTGGGGVSDGGSGK